MLPIVQLLDIFLDVFLVVTRFSFLSHVKDNVQLACYKQVRALFAPAACNIPLF